MKNPLASLHPTLMLGLVLTVLLVFLGAPTFDQAFWAGFFRWAHVLSGLLWVGLLYDQNALDAAWDLARHWDAETREALRVAASVDGLAAETHGVKMLDLAREVVTLAEAGLKARARPGAGGLVPDETHFLNALKDSIDSGQTPADELLARYHGDWQGDLTRIYAEYSY